MKINKKKLVNLMIDSNMNNNRLSKASGVSLTRVSLIKNGHNTTYETICKIASALGTSANELIEDDKCDSVLDKIKKEVQSIDVCKRNNYEIVADVIEIIDKYKGVEE